MVRQEDKLSFYTVDGAYVDYLAPHAPHLFRNAKAGQAHSRKYVGIVLRVNGLDYFAPLSSFKEKHRRMKDGLDFIKVKHYAVINLNNMFPVPAGSCQKVDFKAEPDARYRALRDSIGFVLSRGVVERRQTTMTDYRLKQAADCLCTIELAAIKYAAKEDGGTYDRFFGGVGSFKRNWLTRPCCRTSATRSATRTGRRWP